MNQNTNLSEADYQRLLVDRANARYARKVLARWRYFKRYFRIRGLGTPLWFTEESVL